MEEGGAAFGDEVKLLNSHGPSMPKYMNRVHTGYDCNKYNQTHYDHDNPPRRRWFKGINSTYSTPISLTILNLLLILKRMMDAVLRLAS